MKYLAVLLALAFASCAPRAVVVQPIAPAAARVRAVVEASATASKKVVQSAQKTQQKAAVTDATITKAVANADRLATAGTATKADLDANAAAWRAAWSDNLRTVDSVQNLQIDAKELETATANASTETAALETAAKATDKTTETLKTQIVSQGDDAALGRQMKRAVWIVIVVAVLAGLVFAFIKLAPLVIKAAKPL